MLVNIRLPHPTAQHSIIVMNHNLHSQVLGTDWYTAFHVYLADHAAGIFPRAHTLDAGVFLPVHLEGKL